MTNPAVGGSGIDKRKRIRTRKRMTILNRLIRKDLKEVTSNKNLLMVREAMWKPDA